MNFSPMNPPSNKEDPSLLPDGELIYIADDEPQLVHLAEMSLQKDGYRIKKFYTGETAFQSMITEPFQPGLLLTDYAMRPIQ